jgi:hypothetical protein
MDNASTGIRHPGQPAPPLHDDTVAMLRDLLWLNALIATELIQLVENSSAILRKGDVPESCLREHAKLRAVALDIADRYRPGTELRHHVEKHG